MDVPVGIAHGVLNIVITLVGPPFSVPRHSRRPYCILLILRQQENGGMVRLAKQGKRGSLVEWYVAVVQSSFSPDSRRSVLMAYYSRVGSGADIAHHVGPHQCPLVVR